MSITQNNTRRPFCGDAMPSNPSTAFTKKDLAARKVKPPKVKTILVGSVILTRDSTPGITTIKQSQSWREGVSENEIRGIAVEFALRNCPGFAVNSVQVFKIEVPFP